MENLVHYLFLKLISYITQMIFSSIEHSITVLASIATLISALAAMMTIRTMKRQIHSSYLPEIFVSADHSNKVLVQKNNDITSRKITCWFDHGGISEKYSLRIILNNVGLGAAKNIVITWRFDHEQAIEKIKDQMDNPIYFQSTSDKKSVYVENLNGDWVFYISLEKSVTRLDYVLPIKDGPFDMSPVIPDYIVKLHILHFLYKNNLQSIVSNNQIPAHQNPADLFEEFPKLDMNISYEDIAGNKFEKIFRVNPLIMPLLDNAKSHEASASEGLSLNFFLTFSDGR